MKRYLITGGAGFIGSHLVDAVVAQGESVRVLDDLSSGRKENLLHAGEVGKGRLEVIEADIRDRAKVADAVHGVDVVFHEAAFISVPESLEKPRECLDANVNGTSILLEEARRAGVHRVVIASSAAVYGDNPEIPLAEDTLLKPLSPYAVSKEVTELYAKLYTHHLGLEVTALRYFNVYGPRQNPDSQYAAAVPIFIRRLLDGNAITIFGDGGQTRDLIYVGDVVRANLLAAAKPEAAGEIFNICAGEAISIRRLVQVLRGFFPESQEPVLAPPRPGDIYASVGRRTRAETSLGFRPETRLEQGLKATVEWMR